MELFSSKQHWLHFIGQHYRSHQDFLREARNIGITRRIPAQVARGFNFGDIVTLLRWEHGNVYAFAEMRITGLNLNQGIADAVGEKLQQQGKATSVDGGGHIDRECGSYDIGGTWRVEATIPEILELAEAEATQRGEKLWVMIGGKLSQVYESPRWLIPSPAFTRSFQRANEQTTFVPFKDNNGGLTSISNYRQKLSHGQRSTSQRQKAPRNQTALAFT